MKSLHFSVCSAHRGQKKRLPPRMQGDDVQLGGRWLDGPQAYIPEGRRFDQKHHDILQENHGKPPYW